MSIAHSMAGIECTGQALSVVRGWFKDDNIEDDELDADELDPKQAALVPRPARCARAAAAATMLLHRLNTV